MFLIFELILLTEYCICESSCNINSNDNFELIVEKDDTCNFEDLNVFVVLIFDFLT
jgi:hypothetical protein